MPHSPPRPWNLFGISVQGDLDGITYYRSQRGKLVWFPKSPPLNPPSPTQTSLRNAWRLYAAAWRALTPAQREAYRLAADGANLRITGYNLWIYINRTRDFGTLETIEQQSGQNLARP